MFENSTLATLDSVLNVIAEKQHWRIDELFERLNIPIMQFSPSSAAELFNMFEKLIKDGYITRNKGIGGNPTSKNIWEANPEFISITFDGMIFLEQGGYTAVNNERLRISTLESRQRKLTVVTFVLTLVIAVSTVIAAVYYFLEIKHLLGNPLK